MRALLLLVLLLSGCGFQPLYTNAPHLGLTDIAVERIPNRNGQRLKRFLEEDLAGGAVATAPRYRLAVELSDTTDYLGIQRDASASYGKVRLSARYRLLEGTTERTSGTVYASYGYTITGSQYASLSAEDEARSKALQQLSMDISRRLLSVLTPQP